MKIHDNFGKTTVKIKKMNLCVRILSLALAWCRMTGVCTEYSEFVFLLIAPGFIASN